MCVFRKYFALRNTATRGRPFTRSARGPGTSSHLSNAAGVLAHLLLHREAVYVAVAGQHPGPRPFPSL